MKQMRDIEAMRETAYAESLKADDQLRLGLIDPDEADRDRAFAQGVESALLWALSDAGSPFSD